jgi:hypothetical protein
LSTINRPLLVDQLLAGAAGLPYLSRRRWSSDSLSTLPAAASRTGSSPGRVGLHQDQVAVADRQTSPADSAVRRAASSGVIGGVSSVGSKGLVTRPEVHRDTPEDRPEGAAAAGQQQRLPDPAAVQVAGRSDLVQVRGAEPSGRSSDDGGLNPPDPEADDHDHHDDCQLQEAILVDGSNQISSVALMDLGWTFQLHSSPSSSKVIYLDFDGHTTTGTSWNASMGASFYSPAYDLNGNPGSFSSEELSRIQQIWQRVAADFAPFDVNVTTQAPPTDWLIKSGSTDPDYGMRVVITNFGPSSTTAGGIARVNSFNASTDTPCFVYNKSLTGVAEAISHEVGHTLGLSHDGSSSGSYYYGHGSGETSWAPIMGVGYNKNVTQWSNGGYYNSTNKSSTANYGRGPDDIAIITTYNGFGYQPDLVGNGFATATPLLISEGQVAQFGRIESALDSDYYSFALQASGSINLKFDPYWYRAFVDRDGLWGGASREYIAPVSDGNGSTSYADSGSNLDISVSLYSSIGALLGTVDGAGLATTLAWSNLTAGTYLLRLDGVGSGNPTSSSPSGYSDYGSIGNYFISGTISGALSGTISGSIPGTISGSTTQPSGGLSSPALAPLTTTSTTTSTSTISASRPSSTAGTLTAASMATPRTLSLSAQAAADSPDPLTGPAGPTALSLASQVDPLLAPHQALTSFGSQLPVATNPPLSSPAILAPLQVVSTAAPILSPPGPWPGQPSNGSGGDRPWSAAAATDTSAPGMVGQPWWQAA